VKPATQLHLVLGAAAFVLVACQPTPLELAKAPIEAPTEAPTSRDAGAAQAGQASDTASEPSSKPKEPRERGRSDEELLAIMNGATDKDPLKGHFTMADATSGIPGQGPLVAQIHTSMGDLRCDLDATRAPITVANFVGLARGRRPWKSPEGPWVLRPAYDGTTFHRIIPGFMVQGGDPAGTGAGEPGYVIPDEGGGAKHDRAGLLCMANRGPNTNGMQFFITDANTPHLDGSRTAYTIFGECAPLSVVHAIANVPTGVADRPLKRVDITSITIERR
jgi:peptidyl-prolyl cis-trans isomerase A (cyclophilin A)